MDFINSIINNLDSDYICGLTDELKGLFIYKKFTKENN